MMDISQYKFAQNHRMHNTKRNHGFENDNDMSMRAHQV